jgi:hypothetical protein
MLIAAPSSQDFAVAGAQLRARAQNILLPWLHQAQVTSARLRRRRDTPRPRTTLFGGLDQ